MTLSPEERAKAVWRECFDGRRSTKSAVDIIATAIREAEDAALERAAQMLAHRAMTFLPPDTQLLAKCAAAVRGFKSKD